MLYNPTDLDQPLARNGSSSGNKNGSGMRKSASGRVIAELPPTLGRPDSVYVTVTAIHFCNVLKLRHAARRMMREEATLAGSPEAGYPSLGAEKPPPGLVSSVKYVLFYSKLNLLLLAALPGLLAKPLRLSAAQAFISNFVAIIPLAQLLGVVTEEVALYSSELIGGLLNATLGNATELIISIFAIRAGLLRVVQVSLLGSILSNLLLVMGCSFCLGGIRFREQHYSQKMASINCSLLKMAVLGLVIPTAFVTTMRSSCAVPCRVAQIYEISHCTAIVLFALYVLLLFFQLHTHSYLNDGKNENDAYLIPGHIDELRVEGETEDDEEEEVPAMTLSASVLVLAVLTTLIALSSENLVGTLELAVFFLIIMFFLHTHRHMEK
mmetsp:Transcript_31414/g.72203  ORF Transcript_31414/g.72203 Transcript_31414/m.72203 type:complete len:381 (-) Transcript_31414:624-1766(-)